jgi:membrane-associated phospholipid phosphatase
MVAPVVLALIAWAFTVRPGSAQTGDAAAAPGEAGGGASVGSSEGHGQEAAAAAGAASSEHGWAVQFVRDVGGDYVRFFSKETALWLGGGGLAALAVHPADDNLSQWAQDENPSMPGGDTYGSQFLHIPVALAVWGIGAAAGSGRVADTGRDLLRAQISVVSWTYAIKVATNRTRPNGDPRSFPSGHASTSFATAMVLQEHLGWKFGIPAFAMAAYTGFSRVAANQHWASDVVFGTAVGLASGRTVTIHLRDARVSLAPLAAPGGGGVLVTALW